MRLDIYFLLLAGAGLASASPPNVMISTTEFSAIRIGHAAANTGPALVPDTKPTKMRHLCKNMQNAVQSTATRFLAIIGISRPPLSVPEGGVTRVQFIHKFIPVPMSHPALAIKEGDPRFGSDPDVRLMHHGMHNKDKGGHPRGPFLHRVHRALLSLGPWEGRIVAFVLGCGIGVLLRMFWVLAVLLVRGVHSPPDHEEETVFVFAEEVAPPYREFEEKKLSDAKNAGED